MDGDKDSIPVDPPTSDSVAPLTPMVTLVSSLTTPIKPAAPILTADDKDIDFSDVPYIQDSWSDDAVLEGDWLMDNYYQDLEPPVPPSTTIPRTAPTPPTSATVRSSENQTVNIL